MLSDTVDFRSDAELPGLDLSGHTTTLRLYGLAAIRVARGAQLNLNAGYAFGTVGDDELDYGQVFTDESAHELTYSTSVEGGFATLGIAVSL